MVVGLSEQTGEQRAVAGDSARQRVQLQFADRGERAAEVETWLADHFPHLEPRADAQPGLIVSIWVPAAAYDGNEPWGARLVAATGPLDVALEILSECFSELMVHPSRVLSIHVTD